MRRLANYIDGAFEHTKEILEDRAPATGEVIATLPRSGGAEIDAAVQAARIAQPAWARLSTDDRANMLDAIADRLAARQGEIAELESLDTGKPIALARKLDMARAIANFRFFAGAVRHDATACHAGHDALNYTLRRPLGVVALITPWNLPLYLLSWKTAPALAMGNTVVAKPSELTPLTANALAEVVHAAGVPKGVFNLVHGVGAEAGAALVAHPDLRAVSFTGGTTTGAGVAATAAPQFKKLSLELGGKNATIVFADADLTQAIDGAVRAGFLNQGQICLCGSRILVERPIYDRFVTGLTERVSALRVGDPSSDDTDLGALISAAHRDKVERYVQLAQAEGGRIVCGGTRPPLEGPLRGGYFFAPTVVVDLAPSCRTATEEIFGPLVTVHAFDSEADAVTLANGVPYGLAASLWTRDLARAHRVAAALETGMVWVNTWLLRDLRVPFGGMKASGVGREGGTHSLDFFSEARNVCIALEAP